MASKIQSPKKGQQRTKSHYSRTADRPTGVDARSLPANRINKESFLDQQALTPLTVLQLQRKVGNRAVRQLLAGHVKMPSIQRRIAIGPGDWLGNQLPTRALLSQYFNTFVKSEYQRVLTATTEANRKDLHWNIVDYFDNEFTPAFKAHLAAAQWAQATALMEQLVTRINKDLATVNLKRYPNTSEDSWKTPQAALARVIALVDPAVNAPGPPSDAKMPKVPGIKFSVAQANFPKPLVDLMKDIHTAWQNQGFIDERTEKEIADSTITSKEPGSLRSWHSNTQGSLPSVAAPNTPANAQPLEAHYRRTSKSGAHITAGGPIGFAEYTGTGISDDVHNSKVVFNYRDGHMFLTLSHYQLWTPGKDDAEPKIGDQTAGSGTQSTWFYIDMNS